MKTRVLPILLLTSMSLNLTGCFSGRTNIVATQYASRPYDIYLNGYLVCKMGNDDDCSFQTRGTRAGGILEAYLDGQRVGSIEVHRSMSFATLLWALPTYTLSLWLYQAYPDEIEIPIDTYVLRQDYKGNSTESVSVWDRPYNTTKKAQKKVKQEETIPADVEEPKAVRGENAEPTEEPSYEEAAPAKSVWD
ncbi:hypothetical protein [Fibrobacter sp. UWB12]|uniref:hypothetical protein n=1 Tax=Fibrobacter sp. UWB12 TaxID=1896203 RepID=UPI000923B0FA|nr:hypothetical protein [Fibrobacter sp. UWB12]SHK70350.1 hypothetical protein SAMN05720759_105223 [Fibrobacter sp. UWB12]